MTHKIMVMALVCGVSAGCLLEPLEPDEDHRLVHQREQPLPEGYRRVVYLNRTGGQFIKGRVNDAQANTSTVLEVSGPVTIPPFGQDDASWASLVACVRERFWPYDLRFATDAEPEGPHMEVVIGGWPQDAQLTRQVEGLAPQRLDCQILERGVAFVFSDRIGADPEALCWATAHELGHLLGLDHTLHCGESMSYIQGCGVKQFRDEELLCGEYEGQERECLCGGATQNSHTHLLRALGPARHEQP